MKKVLSLVSLSVLAACSCSENQWEEVDTVVYEKPAYVEPAPIVAEPVVVAEQVQPIVRPEPVYVNAQQPVYDCPCAEVRPTPCYQPTCYQPCPCQQVVMPAPKPKITTTKKIITTTTTVEEPCGKPVCEPVVTTHEEVIPAEVTYSGYNQAPAANDYVEVTVEKNPYHSEVVGMRSSSSKVNAGVAAKYSPETYDVVATRATNRMLQDTAAIYDNGRTKTVYIKDTKLLSSDLPYGSQRLKGTVKDVISGAKSFDVVNSASAADFVIDSSADWYVDNNSTPALQYKLAMFDKNGRKVNEWVEVIRQVQE